MAVSADGRHAVTGGHDRTVRVWDLDTGHQQAELSGHGGMVVALAITADGHRAVPVAPTVRVWDLEEGVELAFFLPAGLFDNPRAPMPLGTGAAGVAPRRKSKHGANACR